MRLISYEIRKTLRMRFVRILLLHLALLAVGGSVMEVRAGDPVPYRLRKALYVRAALDPEGVESDVQAQREAETLADGDTVEAWVYVMNELPRQTTVIPEGDWKNRK